MLQENDYVTLVNTLKEYAKKGELVKKEKTCYLNSKNNECNLFVLTNKGISLQCMDKNGLVRICATEEYKEHAKDTISRITRIPKYKFILKDSKWQR